MKRFLITLILAAITGIVFGKIVFDQYNSKVQEVFNEEEKIYVLQQGVYSSDASVKLSTKKLSNYITVKDNQYYRVYVAITKNKDLVDKLKEIYINEGNDIYVRELSTNNTDFIDKLVQYDELLKITDMEADILQIEKQVINKYRELVVKNG